MTPKQYRRIMFKDKFHNNIITCFDITLCVEL